MDSVIGSKGGKCLLTIHFVETSLMLAFLRDANTSKSVTDIFEMLYDKLGKPLFKRLFPVILTDNGSEFSNPKAIEYSLQDFVPTYFTVMPAVHIRKGLSRLIMN
jgi:IS30 family transposase